MPHTALYTATESQIYLMFKLRMEIDITSQWLKANKFTASDEKTKYIVFGTAHALRNMVDMNLYMNGEKLKGVPYLDYLGVLVDQHLNFYEHVAYLHSKAIKKLSIVRKSVEFLDRLTTVIHLVLLRIDYFDIVYE